VRVAPVQMKPEVTVSMLQLLGSHESILSATVNAETSLMEGVQHCLVVCMCHEVTAGIAVCF